MNRNFLSILVVVLSVVALMALHQLNMIVHEDLYGYGLRFNESWAVPYWNLLHVTAGLVASSAVLALAPYLLVLLKGRAGAEAGERRQVFRHTLLFGSERAALSFRNFLWGQERLSGVEIRVQKLGGRSALLFDLPEPIEDLNSFGEIEKWQIRPKEVNN